MYHPYNKRSLYLRSAIFKVYKEQCAYCGRHIEQRDMHIDHIIPSNPRETYNEEVLSYINELKKEGFILNSIENYLPTCAPCNIGKSNQLFRASNLRYYHEKARKNVDKIIRLIDTMGQDKEFFYSPVNNEVWEAVNFSYQRDLSHAIMGYRLTPADVLACPRFPQIEKIKKQLEIVDYTILQGETGCGKSISIYQAAYDFYLDGWKVYRLKKSDNIDELLIEQNTESSLYLIDDAQQLSESTIELIKMQARPNAKILMSKTVSSKIGQDTILLTNKDAVNILFKDFNNRKEEIVAIVSKYDENVGIRFMDEPIEWRLKNAENAINPWHFNYILRGGWQDMKERYHNICSKGNCDLLAVLIATTQILKLDNSINISEVKKSIEKIDNKFIWDEEDLEHLIDNQIILSKDEVRIIHMQSARRIIALFVKHGNENKKEILTSYIEKSFLENKFSPLGIVWLSNTMLGFDLNLRNKDIFITEEMIGHSLSEINQESNDEERKEIIMFMEKTYNLDYEKNGRYYFDKQKKVILEWIKESSSDTAYTYSRLLNTLINEDEDKHKKFVNKIDWSELQERMTEEENPDLYVWGELYSRLTFSLSEEKLIEVGKILEPAVEELCDRATVYNIGEMTHFLNRIIYLNSDFIYKIFARLEPIYAKYFRLDMSKALELFDFNFLRNFCGLCLLGNHEVSENEKKLAKIIVEIIPEKEFTETIINVVPREWRNIHPIMATIYEYNPQKANNIVKNIDLEELSDRVKNCWDYCDEIIELCIILFIGDAEVAEEFIRLNLDKINIMYTPLAMISLNSALEVFDQGIKVDLLTNHWWGISLEVLERLNNINPIKTKEILKDNSIKITNRINDITAIHFDDDDCLNFLRLIKSIDQDVFNNIVSKLNVDKIKTNWDKGYIREEDEESVEQRRLEFFQSINQK